MIQLDSSFLTIPLCHRAYHDVTQGRPENSIEAIRAAINAGYGIEIDVQLSRDGVAMVFHDYDLDRLTARTGFIATDTAGTLRSIPLYGGNAGIPTLAEVLALVDGQIPVLIEIKDQSMTLGDNIGPLERAVADDILGYTGPIAVMSFNPHSVALMRDLVPHIARGLTTGTFMPASWPTVPEERLIELRPIPDLERTGASFISHRMADLSNTRIREISQMGLPVLCWTVKSEEDEMDARLFADNITFEGYAAKHP